jgi:predicted N-formylglutamate amidohydrolase
VKHHIVISCEHGGNRVPARYRRLFRGRSALLDSHRGYDAGALELALDFAAVFRAPLIYSTTSRLVVDLNRSPGHAQLFSRITARLPHEERRSILSVHYHPYRKRLEEHIGRAVRSGRRVLHLSCHSFTPRRNGHKRQADLGLLYDPARAGEKALCARWRDCLLASDAGLRVRRNYPYRGTADAMTAYLRRRFGPQCYLGIELEVNQKYPRRKARRWSALRPVVIDSLERALTG